MTGIHKVFPANEVDTEDAISLKKILKGEGQWVLIKDILGFMFDGIEKTLWLEEPKREALLATLQKWIWAAPSRTAGIPFEEF